jgi:outer membrane protein OmpA-like peptidoglycan-associated protein
MTPRRPGLARLAMLVLLAACGGSAQQQPGKVVVSETKVEILEPITFTGEAELTPSSYQTLDALARTFTGNPSIKLVEVQAFVLDDAFGDEAARQQIADRRAKLVVDYLIGKQVAASRLIAQGYATAAPDAPRLAMQFLILKRGPDE